MKKLYGHFCKVEETLVKSFLISITLLVFLSAIFRTIKYPINWAVDLSMLLFAWVIFLGADMAIRKAELVNMDLLINRLTENGRKIVMSVWNVVILLFLGFLLWYGVPLAMESTSRQFQTLGISYSWATISVPVGAFLMMVSTVIKIRQTWKKNG
ncbi:hypothetical protein WQ57_13850 [Mesobacillus campisalis]|uniref:Tripartite ATP-independent periplasmic transporters DctQ component domain-containing protein n=1 Tax=Mesobacillus campisalis TaxID=1408103 RepID=A0A0M2STQ9_9BACI|nr:TRAP transporter small permease [Mesobacillus campisalis]KKK37518.1 hypothetical protein WQ57_13850 [Mesobacillus campisalis]